MPPKEILNLRLLAKEQLSLSDFDEYENVIERTITLNNFCSFTFYMFFKLLIPLQEENKKINRLL